MSGRRIGLMGGTFDPIHYGHLVTAEEVRSRFELEQVVFIPSGRPPHKAPEGVTVAEHRYLMAVLATTNNPSFQVSRLDIDRPGPSYTVETLALARHQYGPEAELYFITGADALLEILTWKAPERLLSLCQLVAATRPGYPVERVEKVAGELSQRYQSRVQVVAVPAVAISSSEIRERVRAGRSIRYLVPDSVAEYIYKHRLYRGEGDGAGGGGGRRG